jgi:uncharacterized phage-associated protein
MQDVEEIAEYFIKKTQDSGGYISPLKLQKVLYYAQGYHLAAFDTPLFDDEIQAWQHGPVAPKIYHKYKSSSQVLESEISAFSLPEGLVKFLDNILDVYGRYSAWQLREMTHHETPWLSSYEEGVTHKVISQLSLKDFFKKLI